MQLTMRLGDQMLVKGPDGAQHWYKFDTERFGQTGTPSSTPREVLFIVSDGVDDEVSSTCSQALDGNRCQQQFNTTWCTTVKNRGILIAVLYTVYLPLPTNSWYNNWIAPFQNQISPNMESCASPGLFFSVTTTEISLRQCNRCSSRRLRLRD